MYQDENWVLSTGIDRSVWHGFKVCIIIFNMKKIYVAAAVIEKDEKILIAKRAYGSHAGYWEFPGGKLENGESSKEAIIREIFEEFEVKIIVQKFLTRIEHSYEEFDLVMDCYICQIEEGEMILHDHSDIRYIDPFEDIEDMLEADRKVIQAYRKMIE